MPPPAAGSGAQPVRIARVDVLVADAAVAAERYARLFGPPRADGAFTCGGTAVALTDGHDDDLRSLLRERGEGVASIELAMPGNGPGGELDAEVTHGARIALRYA